MAASAPARRLRPTALSILGAAFLLACGTGSQTPEGGGTDAPAARAAAPEAAEAPRRPSTTQPAGGLSASIAAPHDGAPAPPEAGTPPAPGRSVPPRLDPSGHRVYTNADLEKYRRTKEDFGFSDRRVTVDLRGGAEAAAAPGGAPDGGAGAARRDEEIASTRAAIESVAADLDHLRSRIPSLHNPFLPRVQPAAGDREAEEGMDNAQRLQRVQQRIAEGEARLAELRRQLADLTREEATVEPSAPERP